MSATHVFVAVCSALFLGLFMTGNTAVFAQFVDIGVTARDLPYVLALPATAVFALYMLRV